jgi:hypothetical protein
VHDCKNIFGITGTPNAVHIGYGGSAAVSILDPVIERGVGRNALGAERTKRYD